MKINELSGDFDDFWKKIEKPLKEHSKSIRKEVGTQMGELDMPPIRLRKAILDLFDRDLPTAIPKTKSLKSDFRKFRGGEGLPLRAAVYWYYLHSRTHDLDGAMEVDRKAFFEPSERDPNVSVGVTYKEKFGKHVFTPQVSVGDDKLNWRLSMTQEERMVRANFYELTCRLSPSNESAEAPAKLCFVPYLQVREVCGLMFGFKRATIYTSLSSAESGAEVVFNGLYDDGHDVEGAELRKSGSKFKGQWTVKNGLVPLDGDYPFTHEVASIKFKEMEMTFDVELRIDGFSSTICHADGSELTQENKRVILCMLIGEKVLGDHGGDVADLLLTSKSYRLFKENPND